VRQTLLKRGFLMIAPMARITFVVFALLTAAWPATVHAQDVPGIEICTVEKTMERRTSCLQSNVDFLQKTITKLTADHQQKIDASNRQIEALKGAVIGLQKLVTDMQAVQNKAAEDAKKAATPPAKEAAPVAKDAAPAKEGTK
jgi:TolA-binding protein